MYELYVIGDKESASPTSTTTTTTVRQTIVESSEMLFRRHQNTIGMLLPMLSPITMPNTTIFSLVDDGLDQQKYFFFQRT
jgi:hypothetical protein